MNPLNQEHNEANQHSADTTKEAFMATLSIADQKKFKAVQKAVETLQKAKLDFYLFPMLPSAAHRGKNQVWQWNSLGAKMKYNADGKPTPQSIVENAQYHEAFFSYLFNQFYDNFKGENVAEKLEFLPYFFAFCLKSHHEYLVAPAK